MDNMDNKELEEFVYVASHDLQEPLRKITSFSERLKEKLPTDIDPDIQMYLSRILVATGNMRNLIENLLEFSRTSRFSEPFTQVELNEIIMQVKSDLELKIEETNTIISTDNLPTIEGIALQMRQLFTNLLTNAIKFKSPDKHPVITITSRPVENNKYEITVKDEGIGFEQEYATRIFQIFQRLHGKSEYPGSGIGLAICKKIVDNHHGEIIAKSEAGKGASFIITLPQSQTVS
jgi:light-regulated signal transduction histidine kinase (bacteriophytochrome)